MKEKGRIPEESHQMPELCYKKSETQNLANLLFFFFKKADKNDLNFCSQKGKQGI